MPKRNLVGLVVSTKMMKSITVAVTRTFLHPVVGKTVRETKKYMVRPRLGA